MLTQSPSIDPGVDSLIAELAGLRRFAGPAGEFWPAFLATSARLAQADRAILIVRDSNQPTRLRRLNDWSRNGHSERSALTFQRSLQEVADKAVLHGRFRKLLDAPLGTGLGAVALAVDLPLPEAKENCIAAFLLSNVTDAQAAEALVRLQLAADVPAAYQAHHAVAQAKTDVERFASVLDVMVQVNAETRFLAAALAFCNGLEARFQCDRISIGWIERGYIRLKTISHTEKFDKNMAAVKAIESVMEECADQDNEIVWPAPDGSKVIARDHEVFAHDQRVAHLCSVPIRLQDAVVAVLTCERQEEAFSPAELQQLRLACDQAARRLTDLKTRDRWFGARWTQRAREGFAKALGPEHTWRKVFAIVGFAALVTIALPVFNYRVEGNFILRSDEVTFLSAPFDGYIKSVGIRPGDVVGAGAGLLRLKTEDLELEEAAALADQVRYEREAKKAHASEALAEMRIAEALADQAKARLAQVRHRLSQAAIASPFDGVIVEGDLRQRVGSPVKKGDPLIKLARLDTLYIEAAVNERDVQEILDKSSGQIAFITQPKLKFPIRIVRVEPAAVQKDGENLFLVRCAFEEKPEPWWRPGMSGVCKIDVEKRSLGWIVTHRTIDFLRMLLWW